MVKTIVLPLDGSHLAERALPYAATIARRTGASIVLLEAVQADARSARDPSASGGGATRPVDENLLSVASRLRADGVTATVHVSYADPVAAILDAAQHHRADLIVMSTHGRSGLGRMVYGSVADRVLHQAEVPVLLVPSIADHTWPTDRPLTVLLPLDGSAWGEAALGALDTLPLLGPSGAEPLLLRIVETLGYTLWGKNYAYVAVDEAAAQATALSYLTGVAARLAERGYTPRVEVATARSAESIANVARDRGVDLIAMATHGRSGLVRAVMGSVATATVQRAGVPILLVRPDPVQSARVAGPE